jgi:hypothetical protein
MGKTVEGAEKGTGGRRVQRGREGALQVPHRGSTKAQPLPWAYRKQAMVETPWLRPLREGWPEEASEGGPSLASPSCQEERGQGPIVLGLEPPGPEGEGSCLAC